MKHESNPYSSPAEAQASGQRVAHRESIWRTLGRSVSWCVSGIGIGLLTGALIGCVAYPLYPPFFNNTIYPPEWEFGNAYSAKVHIQTCIDLALNCACLMPVVGFCVPWLCRARRRFRQSSN
jgi:hypothetical protein